MLVGERMSRPGITIAPDMNIHDALEMMRQKQVRRFPVVKKDKLAGIVSEKDLLNASPSKATTLSVWELNYLLSKITVAEVMTKKVITVSEDTPIEEAAYIMFKHKIGGLPVVENHKVVGIITETDLFRVFIEMLGAQEEGVRVTALVPEKHGELAEVTRAVAEAGGNFVSLGTFAGEDASNRILTFKVTGLSEAKVQELIAPLSLELVDIRTCC